MNSIRAVVVDDEAGYAQAIGDSLAMESDIELVGVGYNGLDAVGLARQLPDVILLDLDMPVMGGLEALRMIKEQTPSAEVLILTVHEDDDHLFKALQMGATGYLLKDSSLDEVTLAVREVARGAAAIPPGLAMRVLAEFQRMANQAIASRHLFAALSHQELKVLRLIGLKRTNRQIAEELFVELTTVKKHVTNIRQKLEVNSRVETALLAQSSGLAEPASGT
jgi:DNA-binding NarL/FixJ family response regulator